ncbi:MAG TPA: DUF177 domain-containing protein [Solirubrobacter sp.]|nr:DUF177 domain-containing protein [Solirubrobacter sp.]
MPQRTDTFDLSRLGLTSGEGRRLDLFVHVDPFDYGGSRYAVAPELIPARVDVSRTTANGWALRLRFTATVEGPCMRCLEDAGPEFSVDAYEVHQPGGGEELTSPYLEDDLDLHAWGRDALALALPSQITCREDCAGLCPQCGANLNEDPTHEHEREPDPRWAKLSELKFD